MCGIAGIFYTKREQRKSEENLVLLKKMTDSISHRGPDGEGHFSLDEGNMYLGHRRLAILDLSEAAAQPMSSLDKRYSIAYNGEVYNYKELRNELKLRNYNFFSESDTEVVMNVFAEWGIDGVKKLNGIFAFAIWDNCNKKLTLVCDRYGTKPLYYTKVDNQILFASEYKAIIQHPLFQRKINLCALKQYFTFQNIFTNDSFLDGISILASGHYIEFSYDMKRDAKQNIYWDYHFEDATENISKEEYEEELERLFVRAVKRQLVSDVPIGTYLSGGIDSGSITAIAAKKMPYMQSFTCGFDLNSVSGIELSYDEREKAELMSYLFKTEHYEMVLKAGDMERCMKDLVWHIEDPRVGQSYPNYYAAKLSSHFVKVVLAGTGGDEMFAGYPWRYYRAVNNNSFDEYADKYYSFWQRLLSNQEIEDIFKPVRREVENISCNQIFKNVFQNVNQREVSPEQCVNYSLYFELKTFLRGLLIVDDKISMAHGLETRVPFLDNDLVDFALKIPVNLKLNNLHEVVRIDENEAGYKKDKYFQKTKDGKTILRNVMYRYIPPEITKAVKQGFSAPDASWFRGDSIEYVKSVVDNGNAKMYSYLDRKIVQKIVNSHVSGEENKRLFIWSILNFEQWCNMFL